MSGFLFVNTSFFCGTAACEQGSAGVERSEAGTLLTITQGGVHRGVPSPCAATPPRLALSGALVLNAGYEYRR
ncbi:MTSS I-BAR domain containing 2a [Lates japonicus]|uniref:MTSS I-BAR domain containing 2a n=1 Tax=Lates japonicus TaxID=270547 RepID=A0AAD3R9K0_LATJO|nr:MTSS I-BAR domain containing 2a [Lates japonicus]